MSGKKSSSILHYAILWIIDRYTAFLRENNMGEEMQYCHRITHDHLIFLICHHINVETGGALLPVCTRFFPAGHGGDAADFATIKKALMQCSEQGWLELPSIHSGCLGYRLTEAGKEYLDEHQPWVQKIKTTHGDEYDLHTHLAESLTRFAGEPIRKLKSRVYITGKFFRANKVK